MAHLMHTIGPIIVELAAHLGISLDIILLQSFVLGLSSCMSLDAEVAA